MELADAISDHPCHHRRGQPAGGRQQPLSILIELTDDARARVGPPVVELFLKLVLDEGALFLDDEDLVEPLGEFAHALFLERPDHADLVDAQADLAGLLLRNSQIVEGLSHVEIGLAGGDDAKPRLFGLDHRAVDPIGSGEGQRGVNHVPLQTLLGGHAVLGHAHIEAARRHLEIVWQVDLQTVGIDRHRGCTLDHLGDRLEADPAARIARHGPAEQPEIEDVLDMRGVEQRRHHRSEHVVGLVRQGRGAGYVIVAGAE